MRACVRERERERERAIQKLAISKRDIKLKIININVKSIYYGTTTQTNFHKSTNRHSSIYILYWYD